MLNIMNLWEDSKRLKTDRVPKDGLYWAFWIIWPITGGLLGILYFVDGSVLRPLASFSLGIGAPTTLKSLMHTAAQPRGSPGNAED